MQNSIPDSKFGEIIFEVVCQNDIISRFDRSNEFWGKFNVRDKALEKKLGYLWLKASIIHITLLWWLIQKNTMSILKILIIIKNTKVKMNFENFAAGIADSNQIDHFDAPNNECIEQQRFTIIGGEMQKSTITKTKLPQTNDKRYYYLNGTTSLPVSHRHLNDIAMYKEKKGEKIEKNLYKKKAI